MTAAAVTDTQIQPDSIQKIWYLIIIGLPADDSYLNNELGLFFPIKQMSAGKSGTQVILQVAFD